LSMQIHKTKLIVACWNVAKAPKIGKDYLLELLTTYLGKFRPLDPAVKPLVPP